jgi:hypothetical protein
MHPALIAAFAEGRGVLTRLQALDHGLTPSRIDHLVRTGEWIAVRRGVYTPESLWAELDEWRGRPRLRTRAALASLRRGFVVSHDSAALELGLAVLPAPEPHVHITRPGYSSAWTRRGVKHHYARFAADQVVEVDGLPVLDAARTAVDVAREHGFAAGVVTADSALRHGASKDDLVSAYLPMSFWPGVVVTRQVVDFACGLADNASESLARILVSECDLGPIDPQFPLVVDGQIVWVDLMVGPHAIEVDGRVKYTPVADGGVAHLSPSEVVWNEKLRERAVTGLHIGMSRLVYADYWGDARLRAKERLIADVAISRERYGPDIPAELRATAERIRRDWIGPGRRRRG